ncbi:DMT family transporter [Glycomyces sp. NPDC046736]|uniref:DMT family transporter n=1 Tax=Glycomyces sp. NPDC046736 TaxID=3155615 RepID=UPI0033C0CD39
MSDRFNTRAALAVGVTVLCWASAFVSIRDVGRHLDPGPLTLGRAAVAAVVLLAVWAVRREGLPDRRAWPGIVTSGILWFGVYMVALNWGEQLVDAGTAALIVNIGPILIALLGGWLLKEGFPPRLFLGIAVSFAGVAVVSLSMSQHGASSVVGVLLCLVSAITYAISVVVQKPTLKHCSSLQFTAFGNAIAAVLCLPFAPLLLRQLEEAPTSATLHVLYLGLVPTALAFLTWGYALRYTTAGKLGATTYVVPAIVVGMSWLFLSEVPTWLTIAGGAIALIGVAISRSRGRAKTLPPVEATDVAAPATKR